MAIGFMKAGIMNIASPIKPNKRAIPQADLKINLSRMALV